VRSLVDEQTILRRKATSPMADMICSMSPARFWLRDEGRHYDALFEAFCAAHDDTASASAYPMHWLIRKNGLRN
jgi:hypothetical protein